MAPHLLLDPVHCRWAAIASTTCSGAKGGERHVSEPLLTIHNHHSAVGGIPPAVSTEAADLYVGYFENRYGEQWIFTLDRATRKAGLRSGDAGWATAHPVRDGRLDGLSLAPEETAWLRACWSAT